MYVLYRTLYVSLVLLNKELQHLRNVLRGPFFSFLPLGLSLVVAALILFRH